MQAILLCEQFARFRGRKAVVRPSKHFENLYSRVSGSESLVSSFSDDDHVPFFPVSLSESSSSVPSSLSSSSASFCTPSLPAWSPQTSEFPAASSTNQGLYQYDHMDQDPIPFLFSPSDSLSAQQLSSPDDSLINGSRLQAFNRVSFDDAFLSFPSDHQGQFYSDSFSSQVLDHNPNLYDTALPSGAANFGNQQNMGMNSDNEQRWRIWLEAEARRRLLAGCFILDNHAAAFHQQPRARDDVDPSTIPLTAYSDALWAANSANEWAAILDANPATGRTQCLPRLNTLGPAEVVRYNTFDQASILNAAAVSLPRRHTRRSSNGGGDDHGHISPEDLRTPTNASYAQTLKGAIKPDDQLAHLFPHCVSAATPNVYVALHHTPLHDLLAVSGDSWVFCQKVLGAPKFLEHQKRLKAWATEGRSATTSPSSPTTVGLESMSVSKATVFAARALAVYLDRGASGGISDYWGMYVCALIIWAFGHHRAAGKSSSSGSSGDRSPTKKAMGEDEARNWLRVVAEHGGQPEHVARVRGRREASAAVVSMVKRHLEADCVGGRSRLYVDAVGVLKKLEEETNRRWF